jgi:hypothetical protein
MASTAKVLSSPQASRQVPVVRAVPAPAPRRPRWGWLQLLREGFGGALLLVVWLALWTVTWAAVAGPLSPVGESGAARSQVSALERT